MGQHIGVRSGSVAVLLWLALISPTLGETPEEEFAKLEKAFKEQSKESLEKVLKLESREERAALFKERRAAREKFASDAWEFASKYVGKEVAVDALHAVLTNSSRASKPDEESLRSKA